MNIIALDELAEARLTEKNRTERIARQIGTVADIDEAERLQKAIPAFFVSPLAERPVKLNFDDEFVEPQVIYVRVIVVVNNRPSVRNQVSLKGARTFVHGALRGGWIPDGCNERLFRAGAGILKISSTALWWHDDFAMRFTDLSQ